jgi:hypothetical protein
MKYLKGVKYILSNKITATASIDQLFTLHQALDIDFIYPSQ